MRRSDEVHEKYCQLRRIKGWLVWVNSYPNQSRENDCASDNGITGWGLVHNQPNPKWS